MELLFERLNPRALLPSRATAASAGLDIRACLDHPIVIAPGQSSAVPTGLAAAPSEPGYVLLLCARSGLALKHGITMSNGVGVIDADYRGEIFIPLINLGSEPFTVTDGMRVAQLLTVPVAMPVPREEERLPGTSRGAGGFGSSGL